LKFDKFSFAGECGLGYPEGNVIGGIDARPGEFPYMALLVTNLSNIHYVGEIIKSGVKIVFLFI
jgi:hypothetical protein